MYIADWRWWNHCHHLFYCEVVAAAAATVWIHHLQTLKLYSWKWEDHPKIDTSSKKMRKNWVSIWVDVLVCSYVFFFTSPSWRIPKKSDSKLERRNVCHEYRIRISLTKFEYHFMFMYFVYTVLLYYKCQYTNLNLSWGPPERLLTLPNAHRIIPSSPNGLALRSSCNTPEHLEQQTSFHALMSCVGLTDYPRVIEPGNWKFTQNWGFNRKIVHCHVWLPEGIKSTLPNAGSMVLEY